MKRKFDGLSQERFDLIVIGGGVIGTGVARDAALRGLKTLLLEKEDFSYGTTSRSTRLIHGGLRYLSHLDFKLVRQDLREREVLLRIAPHLVQPLSFLLPITGTSQRMVMATGMRLYDVLSFDKSIPSYHYHSRRRTLDMEPGLRLEGLKGSYQFYDCQIAFPERLAVENALSAAEHGAWLVNHAEVVGMTRAADRVQKMTVRDTLSGDICEVTGRVVVNVTGHWANRVLRMAMDSPGSAVRTTMGIHLVTPKISNNAMVLFAKSDGRLIFVIPWQGYSLIGTTDTEYNGDLERLYAATEDVAYLIEAAAHAFPSLRMEDIHYTTAGLRSLVGSSEKRVSNISRSHRLIDHKSTDGLDGLVSILGGKMTGYRAIASEAVDLCCKKLGSRARCTTDETPLPGAPAAKPEALQEMARESGLPLDTLAHLNSLYGARLGGLLDLVRADSRGKQPICPHSRDILAQVWHAVNEESAVSVTDFMLRRGTVGLASCQGLDAVEVVAVEMGRLLGWTVGEWQRQVREYRSVMAMGTRFRKPDVADR